MKIFINTSSHTKATEDNKLAFEQLNNLLLSDENPEKMIFNEEHLYLDDTNGFISIIPSSNLYYDDDYFIKLKNLENINKFIRKNLSDKNKNDIKIYIGNDIFDN